MLDMYIMYIGWMYYIILYKLNTTRINACGSLPTLAYSLQILFNIFLARTRQMMGTEMRKYYYD